MKSFNVLLVSLFGIGLLLTAARADCQTAKSYKNGIRSQENNRNLGDSLNGFVELVPTDPLLDILVQYMKNDKEVQDALDYLWSPDFKTIITSLDTTPQFYDFLNYLEDNGVDAYKLLNDIRDLVNVPPLVPPAVRISSDHVIEKGNGKRSLNGMLSDMMSVIPKQKFIDLFEEKLANDGNFQVLIERMRGDEFKSLVNIVYKLPEFQDMLQSLRNLKVNVDVLIDALRKFFKWNI